MTMSSKKIILFGGTFDPVHSGHVRVAEHALNELKADTLCFVPAYQSPHKQRIPTKGYHRIAMIRSAVALIDRMEIDDCEIRRRYTSYTLDTIHHFRDRFGEDAVLFWLIGADQLSDFDRWYRVNELLEQCRVSVMVRAGYPFPDFSRFEEVFSKDHIEQLKRDTVHTPEIDLSSTSIRQQLASGSIEPGALPPAVLNYIIEQGLYGWPK